MEDLTALGRLPDVCKVAFYDEGDAQTHELPVLQAKLEGPLSITLSGEHWVDVMKPGVNKGCAMRGIQQKLRAFAGRRRELRHGKRASGAQGVGASHRPEQRRKRRDARGARRAGAVRRLP